MIFELLFYNSPYAIVVCELLVRAQRDLCVFYLGGEEISSLQFDLSTLTIATKNFSDDNKLGEGGFGQVYKVGNY